MYAAQLAYFDGVRVVNRSNITSRLARFSNLYAAAGACSRVDALRYNQRAQIAVYSSGSITRRDAGISNDGTDNLPGP